MTSETMHARTVKRLVRRAQRGDPGAFETLARSCATSLYRVAASCLGGREADVADAIQDALIAAWRGIGTLKEPGYFKTWLIRICINSCRQIQRHRRVEVPLEAVDEERLDASLRADGSLDEMAQRAAEVEANAAFRKLVAAAGDTYALVMTLYYGEGYSTVEIAGLLAMSEEAVRQRLSRGRKRIERALGENPHLARPDDAPAGRTPLGREMRPRAPAEQDISLMQAANLA